MTDHYPHAPAIGQTETSRDAAQIIYPSHGALRDAVFVALSHRPGTWKEVSHRLGLDSRNVQPRFSELKQLGLIRDTGERRERCAVMEAVHG